MLGAVTDTFNQLKFAPLVTLFPIRREEPNMFSAVTSALATWNANKLAFRVTLFISCLMFLSICPLMAQDAKAGWVLDLKGQWAVSGGTTLLTQAASVPAGGQLVNLAPKDGDFIRIADLHGELLRSLQCSTTGCSQCTNEDTCSAPIEPLPKSTEQAGLMAATWAGLMDLFVGQPERYSIHRSRSLGADTCLADGVVPLDASGSADLEGVMKNCEPGSYTLDFVPAGSAATDQAVEDANEATLIWSPTEHTYKSPGDLHPGLYELRFTRDWRSGSAWILACPAAVFKQDVSSFDKFSAVVDGWGNDVGGDSKVAYKRAYLDYLSRSKGGADQVR